MGPKIAIIGGGIGGLTAAVALARKGLAAEVYEQAPVLEEVGAGVGRVSLNGKGDPKGDSKAAFTTIGPPLLLLLSPSAMSTRGHCCGASRAASSTMDIGIVKVALVLPCGNN